jgi:uroporphyrinogen-III synthase
MKRILITRPQSQAAGFAARLSSLGFEPVFFPVIEIRPVEDTAALDGALRKLGCYDWIVFTSVNGVEIVWRRLEDLAIKDFPPDMRIAAIGPKTAEALSKRGVIPAFVPTEYVAEAILPGLGDLHGRWVLLPRAEIARKALPEAITAAGGVAHEIAIYQTLPPQIDPKGLDALRQGVEVITFTSPSTVNHFIQIAQDAGLDPLNLPGPPRVACIGPITASAASAAGLAVDMVASVYTTEGLVEMIRKQVNR